MKIFFLLALISVPAFPATIDYTTYSSATSAMKNVVISSGTWTDPTDATHTEPVIFVKFTADYGLWGTWHTCAITWVKEFMAVTGDRTLAAAVIAKTAHGYRIDWNDSYKPAPASINPWCLQ